MGGLVASALGWVAGIFWDIAGSTWQYLQDLMVWFGEQLFYWGYATWANLWAFCAAKMVQMAVGLLNALNIPTYDSTVIVSWLEKMNWLFPVDTVFTLLPAWAVFETGLLAARITIKAMGR